MTGIEFKQLIKDSQNKNITVAEQEKMLKKLEHIALETFKKINDKYSHYIKNKYNDGDYLIESDYVYDVYFGKKEIDISFWDDSSGDTSSFINIPIDDFAKWIDNDVSEIQKYIVAEITDTLTQNIEFYNKRIKYYTEEVNKDKKLLTQISTMKFEEIIEQYNERLDGAI